MLSALFAIAAAVPPVLPDPRLGPSSWQVVDTSLAPQGRPEGLLVELPKKVSQDWLARLVALAASGQALVSLGLPEASVASYFDGVVVATPSEVQVLASCCPGVRALASAAHPYQALQRLAWGVRGLLVPPSQRWVQEMGEALNEVVSAQAGELILPTASRAEDLAILVGLPPDFAGAIVELPTNWVAEEGRLITQERQHILAVYRDAEKARVEVPPLPFGGLLVVPRPLPPGGLERVEVAGELSLSLGEILARHHRQAARQTRFCQNFLAWQRLLVRVRVEELQRSFELELAGPVYFTPELGSDWEPEQAWLDGVAWNIHELPELPLIQPQAPKVPPLALELDPSYRYELETATEEGGRRLFVVSFAKREEGIRRWGKAFIDEATFGLARLETYQEAAKGEVRRSLIKVCNFFRREGEIALWLPSEVVADELVAAFGSLVTVHRQLMLQGLELNVADLGERRQQAWRGPGPMFRERRGVVVPLIPDGSGGRREGGSEGRQQRFFLAGLRYDPAWDFPLPLAGYQLLDFRFRGQEQLRLFIAGAINDVAWSRPGKVELSASAFLQAVPFTSSLWVLGREDKSQQLRTFRQRLRAGTARQTGPFRLTLEVGLDQLNFGRTKHTASDFRLPRSTQEILGKVSVHWQKGELLWGLEGEGGWRLAWRSWGFGERSRPQFGRGGVTVLYEHALAPLVRASLGGELWLSWKADRFSRLALGGFGGLAFPGLPSDRVTAERAALLRAQVATPLGHGRRLELTWTSGWFRDATQGSHARPLAAGSLALSAPGPWQTLLQLQVGVPFLVPGPNQPTAQVLLLRPGRKP